MNAYTAYSCHGFIQKRVLIPFLFCDNAMQLITFKDRNGCCYKKTCSLFTGVNCLECALSCRRTTRKHYLLWTNLKDFWKKTICSLHSTLNTSVLMFRLNKIEKALSAWIYERVCLFIFICYRIFYLQWHCARRWNDVIFLAYMILKTA